MKRGNLPVVVVARPAIAVTIAIPVVGVSSIIAVVVLGLVLIPALPQLSSVNPLDNRNLTLKTKSLLTEQYSCPCNDRTRLAYMPEGQPRIQRLFYGVQGLVKVRRRIGRCLDKRYRNKAHQRLG